jgi:hypothetical protein
MRSSFFASASIFFFCTRKESAPKQLESRARFHQKADVPILSWNGCAAFALPITATSRTQDNYKSVHFNRFKK